MNELPAIHSTAVNANSLSLMSARAPILAPEWTGAVADLYHGGVRHHAFDIRNQTPTYVQQAKEALAMPVAKRRLVRVLVVDPDENVPVEKCLLHSGPEQFTDATDQELFFEIDIKRVLDEHNEYRVTLTEKGKTDKAKKLEPARIRDLKMVVVNLAEF